MIGNEIYIEKYLKKFTVGHNGKVQTVLEFAPAAFNLCCDVLGGVMSANGFTVLFPLTDDVTRVVVLADDLEELFEKAMRFYSRIQSASDLHRVGTFEEPEVSVERVYRRR